MNQAIKHISQLHLQIEKNKKTYFENEP